MGRHDGLSVSQARKQKAPGCGKRQHITHQVGGTHLLEIVIETSFFDHYIAFDELGYLLKIQLPTSYGLRHQPRPYGSSGAYALKICFLRNKRMPRKAAHEDSRG
jgi:hypothetical protein